MLTIDSPLLLIGSQSPSTEGHSQYTLGIDMAFGGDEVKTHDRGGMAGLHRPHADAGISKRQGE